ncbi:hypothetical protein THIX_60467 [Thiomonas sp. X19]|uniref:hypothetical protein n=1 Tax=Thiomonas sp. X19 TaxID=1050370 RepID=UPI000B6E34AC|nr:hypothetical protein [Thiomonas sp. X19]SCC94409.1 hypothetical protein THIX_60467 [Thiomonas sp. X19]
MTTTINHLARSIYSANFLRSKGDKIALFGALKACTFANFHQFFASSNLDYLKVSTEIQQAVFAATLEIARIEAEKQSPSNPRHFHITQKHSGQYEIEYWSDADRAFICESLNAKERALLHVLLGELNDRRRINSTSQNPEPTNPTQH